MKKFGFFVCEQWHCEDGFEDIKRTIGGQNVAEWGDQFRVGIQ